MEWTHQTVYFSYIGVQGEILQAGFKKDGDTWVQLAKKQKVERGTGLEKFLGNTKRSYTGGGEASAADLE